jgi:hypothetical protein
VKPWLGEPVNVDAGVPIMPDCNKREDRTRPVLSHWTSLSAELFSYNVLLGTNIAQYWRSAVEISVALMSITVARESPMDRRRKFAVIVGGKG